MARVSIRILHGDCRAMLATLPDASVHCVVTSPPYFGLRDYQTATWEGGDAGCDHARPSTKVGSATTLRRDGREHLGLYDGEKAVKPGYPFRDTCGKCGARRIDAQIGLEASTDAYIATMVEVFRKVRRVMRPDATCWVNLGDGFQNKQLLMMPARLALALQADGWWIRSDIIWAKPNPMPESCTDRPTSSHEHVFLLTKSARYFYDAEAVREAILPASTERYAAGYNASWKRAQLASVTDMRDTGFAGVPDPAIGRNLRNVWTIATAPLSSAFSGGSYRIASRDCGVHDRQADLLRVLECDAQLDVFEFGRSPGKRSRPAELSEGAVVSIPLDRSELPSGVSSAIARNNLTRRTPELSERDVIFGDISGGHIECRGFLDHLFAMFARTPASNTSPDASPDGRLNCQSAQRPDRIVGIATYDPRPDGCSCYYAGTVNKRQDHFASFPPELAERCIKAGTSERGCCAMCGAPWVRVVERGGPDLAHQRASGGDASGEYHGQSTKDHASHGVQDASAVKARILAGMVEKTTTGWAPSCACEARCQRMGCRSSGHPPLLTDGVCPKCGTRQENTIPCTVLDPFAGAFTAPMVADRLQRHAIGIELSVTYCEMARARLTKDAGMFAEIAAD